MTGPPRPSGRGFAVRDATVGDLSAITDIQNAFIATEAIEWTGVPHTLESRRDWFVQRTSLGYPILVAVEPGGVVIGFASFGDFRDAARWPGYRFTVEHTVHVRQDRWGSGVGSALLAALAERAVLLDKHVLVAAIEAGNVGSIALHAKAGFVEVARMPQVGEKFGRWLDLVLMQRLLDEAPMPPA